MVLDTAGTHASSTLSSTPHPPSHPSSLLHSPASSPTSKFMIDELTIPRSLSYFNHVEDINSYDSSLLSSNALHLTCTCQLTSNSHSCPSNIHAHLTLHAPYHVPILTLTHSLTYSQVMTKDVKHAVIIQPDESLWGPIQEIRKQYDKSYIRWMPHINLYVSISSLLPIYKLHHILYYLLLFDLFLIACTGYIPLCLRTMKLLRKSNVR